MKKIGKNPTTKVLSFEVVETNEYLAYQMGLAIGEEIIKIVRLRLADEVPMMVETSYLPYKIFPTLTEKVLEEKPLYDLFEQNYKQIIRAADEEFSATIIPFHEAKLLGVPSNSACLRLSRTTFNSANEVIEFTISYARSDQFIYKVRHTRS